MIKRAWQAFGGTLLAAMAMVAAASAAEPISACDAEAAAVDSGAQHMTLSHPSGPAAVRFEQRVQLPDGDGDCGSFGWRRITVQRPEGPAVVAGQDPNDTALYLPAIQDDETWSPDGRFLVVLRLAQGGHAPTTIQFLDVGRAAWTVFLVGRRLEPGPKIFRGWLTGRPHSARFADPAGKLPEAEALPILE
jgi:hypothetical protein